MARWNWQDTSMDDSQEGHGQFPLSPIHNNSNLAMETIQDIASHLHRIQASAREVFGDDAHTATPDYPCENCNGECVDGADRCWQYHLSRLVTGTNPFGYIENNKL